MQNGLTDDQIRQFIDSGFVRIDKAFSPEEALAVRTIPWRDMPGAPDDPSTWTKPVVWLGMYPQAPFI
ncbi:hypothetical protein [Spirosoma fluminis]